MEQDQKETEEWILGAQTKAVKDLLAAKSGKVTKDPYEGKTPVVDVKGLSGADILRLCGVRNPFGNQKERKDLTLIKEGMVLVGMDSDDDEWEDEDSDDDAFGGGLGGGFSGFSENYMMELACQGVKSWDPDARRVLRALRDF
jgi:hypothetical protein